jgi:hypothetical protein
MDGGASTSGSGRSALTILSDTARACTRRNGPPSTRLWTCGPHLEFPHAHNPWICGRRLSLALRTTLALPAAPEPAMRSTPWSCRPHQSPPRAQPWTCGRHESPPRAQPWTVGRTRTRPVRNPRSAGGTASPPAPFPTLGHAGCVRARHALDVRRTASAPPACHVRLPGRAALAPHALQRAGSPDLSARSRARAAPLRHAPGRP